MAAVAIGALIVSHADSEPTGQAALTANGVTGSARLYHGSDRSGRISIRLHGRPPAPADHHYQLWVLP